jgi:hypothetical protein
MTVRIIVLIAMLTGLGACGGGLSDLNPLKWFRGSDEVAIVPEGGFLEDLDGRILVSQVTSMKVEKVNGGALIRVTGLPPRQGYWDAELVAQNDEKPEDGVLTYHFRIAEPWGATNAGTSYARTVHVAHFVSDFKLRDVRRIQVVAENNSRVARR